MSMLRFVDPFAYTVFGCYTKQLENDVNNHIGKWWYLRLMRAKAVPRLGFFKTPGEGDAQEVSFTNAMNFGICGRYVGGIRVQSDGTLKIDVPEWIQKLFGIEIERAADGMSATLSFSGWVFILIHRDGRAWIETEVDAVRSDTNLKRIHSKISR